MDVVRYLWEEAQWDPVPGLARAGADQGTVLEILSGNAVGNVRTGGTHTQHIAVLSLSVLGDLQSSSRWD